MKFLVDAQLPRRFANWLNEAGQDALHTLDLPKTNLSLDGEIIARARQEGRPCWGLPILVAAMKRSAIEGDP